MEVLVINADLGPLHRVSLQHAVRMLVRQVAVVHEALPERVIGPFPVPKIVRLVKYVVTRWRFTSGPAWSRRGVLARDNHQCGYCNARATTVDHVVPRSRGGRNSWKNTVACCGDCNQRKGDALPFEVGMTLRITPTVPSWATLRR